MNNISENETSSKKENCRIGLRCRLGERSRYTGTFDKNGIKTSSRGPLPTVLFKNITDESGIVVADHVWMSKTKALEQAALEPGDKVTFDASVEEYTRGYFGHKNGVWAPASIDYRLSWPTHVEVLLRADSATRGIEVA